MLKPLEMRFPIPLIKKAAFPATSINTFAGQRGETEREREK